MNSLKQIILDKGFNYVHVESDDEDYIHNDTEPKYCIQVFFNFIWTKDTTRKLNKGHQWFESNYSKRIINQIDNFINEHSGQDNKSEWEIILNK